MTTPNHAHPATRGVKRSGLSPARAGLPDPRPVTGFGAEYIEDAGKFVVKVTLEAPCIIRAPDWGFVNVVTGEAKYAKGLTVDGNDVMYFEFDEPLDPAVAFIDVPYQDREVQNFQGGYVRPGGTWFRPAA